MLRWTLNVHLQYGNMYFAPTLVILYKYLICTMICIIINFFKSKIKRRPTNQMPVQTHRRNSVKTASFSNFLPNFITSFGLRYVSNRTKLSLFLIFSVKINVSSEKSIKKKMYVVQILPTNSLRSNNRI